LTATIDSELALVAQLVEQRTFNPLVLGSSPSERNTSPGGEMADAADLKSAGLKNRVGSSPTQGIIGLVAELADAADSKSAAL
jgi:hypothetical protein